MIYLDAVGYKFLVEEIKERIVDKKIRKIQSHDTNSFTLIFNKENLYFENKGQPLIYLKEVRSINSDKELNFILKLKKYILGSIVTEVVRLNEDRIVQLNLEKLDMLNVTRKFRLIYELTGKSAHVILLDEDDIILASMYPNISSRVMMSGAKYELPTHNGKYGKLMKQLDEKTRTDYENTYKAYIYENNVLTYNDFFEGKDKKEYESLNDAINKYFVINNNVSQIETKRAPLKKYVKRNIKRLNKILEKIPMDIQKHKNYEEYKEIGDLIASNLYQIKEGQSQVTLFNYYNNKEQVVELDEGKSPTQNMKKYYDMYARSKRAIASYKKRVEDVKKELIYFLEQEYFILAQKDILGLEEIEKELGLVNKKLKSNKNKKKKIEKIEYEGFEIYVGSNSIENEKVTFEIGKSNDIWLHAKDVPGSHVIIKGNDVPDNVIYYAAKIAAKNSKLNGEGIVDYCPRKNVSKIPGSSKALVKYDRYNSINVR